MRGAAANAFHRLPWNRRTWPKRYDYDGHRSTDSPPETPVFLLGIPKNEALAVRLRQIMGWDEETMVEEHYWVCLMAQFKYDRMVHYREAARRRRL